MTSAAGDWPAFLDSLESQVRLAGRATDLRVAATFVPPDHLGPLPRELAERARQVLATIGDVTEELRADIARTRTQLDDLHRHDPRGPKPASAFDTRA